MIKVEVLEEEEGKRILVFECNKEEDKDDLDKILEALVGPFPRRGSYLATHALKIEVNTSSS